MVGAQEAPRRRKEEMMGTNGNDGWADVSNWTRKHWVTFALWRLMMVVTCGLGLLALMMAGENIVEQNPLWFYVGMFAILGLLLSLIPYPSLLCAAWVEMQVDKAMEDQKYGRIRVNRRKGKWYNV